MHHVLCLGPLVTQDGERSYCCLTTGAENPGVATGPTKAAALEALTAKGFTAGARCEEGLRAEAEKLGLQVAPLPEALVELKAAMAVGMDHGGDLGGPEHMPLIVDLLHAAAAFDDAAPWEAFTSEMPLTLHVKGAHPRTLEACVLGSEAEEFGLAIYFSRGAVARVERLLEDKGEAAAVEIDSVALMFDEEPEYIADAVEAMTGIAFVPVVLRMRRGKARPLATEELALLAAALRAVAELCVKRSEGRGASTAGPPTEVRATWVVSGPHAAQAAAAAAWRTVGRNEPCPCGSGQKFKRCHGGAGARTSHAPGRSRWHALDERLVAQLTAWADTRFSRSALRDLARALYGERPPAPELLGPWAVYEGAVEGKPIARQFLEERAEHLSADERQWLEAQLAARTSIHEVLEVRPGEGLELHDLFTGERASVHEVSASRMLVPRDVVVGRVTRVPDEQVVAGMHPVPLPPEEADTVLEHLGGGLTTGHPPRTAPPPAGELVAAWCAAAEALERRSQEPGVLKNTDGDPLVLLEDRFSIRPGAREELLDLLAGLEHATVDEDRAKRAHVTFTRPGNPVHAHWGQTVVGNARVTPATLTLSTNSEKRAEALRARVEAAAGTLLTFTSRKRIDTPAPPGGQQVLVDAEYLVGTVPPDPQTVTQEYYRTWPDQPLPALGGARPRERVEDPEGRRIVHRVLRELENASARGESGGADEIRALRRVLGLDALGEPLPDRELDVALGSGRKISECLLDVAQPLLLRGAATAAQAREVLTLAQAVWNAAVADAQDPGSHEVVRERGHHVRSGLDPSDFDLILERKRQRHAGDLRTIEFWELQVGRGKDFNVVAAGSLSPQLAERARAAGLVPLFEGSLPSPSG